MTQQEVDKIFEKWEKFLNEEYVPEGTLIEEAPSYTPTPKSAGPKLITIEQYQARQKNQRQQLENFRNQTTSKKKKGGKKLKFQKACKDLQRIIGISEGKQKQRLIQQLIELRKAGWRNQ